MVTLNVDDTTVFTSADCVTVQWQAKAVRAVTLDRHAVADEGTAQSCAARVELGVTFQDGFTQTYRIAKLALTSSKVRRVLLVAALLAFGLGVFLMTGLPEVLRRSALGRALARTTGMPPARADQRRWLLFAAVGIVLIGAAVLTHYLSVPLATDESRTVIEFASKPLLQGLSDFSSTNNQFFNTIMVHESLSLFGLHRWSIRLGSYFAGIALIAAAYAVGRRFYNPYVGLLAAALTASAAWTIGYSVNARGYVVITLMFLLLLLLASSLLRRRRLRLWLAFAALSIVGLYTILSAGYAIGLVFVWLGCAILIEKRGRDRVRWLRDLALTAGLIALVAVTLYLPAWRYVQAHPNQTLDLDSFVRLGRHQALDVYTAVAQEMWGKINSPWPALAPLLAAGVLISAVLHFRLSRYRMSLMAALVLWIPPVLFIPSLTTYARVWIFLQPLYFVFAGAGLIYVIWRFVPGLFTHARLIASAALVIAALLTINVFQVRVDTSGYPRAEEAVLRIGADMMAGDYALCDWYCPALVLEGRLNDVPLYAAVTHEEGLSEAATFTLASGNRLYVVTRDLTPNNLLDRLKIPADAVMNVTVLAEMSDMTAYRLEFNGALTASQGAAP